MKVQLKAVGTDLISSKLLPPQQWKQLPLPSFLATHRMAFPLKSSLRKKTIGAHETAVLNRANDASNGRWYLQLWRFYFYHKVTSYLAKTGAKEEKLPVWRDAHSIVRDAACSIVNSEWLSQKLHDDWICILYCSN